MVGAIRTCDPSARYPLTCVCVGLVVVVVVVVVIVVVVVVVMVVCVCVWCTMWMVFDVTATT